MTDIVTFTVLLVMAAVASFFALRSNDRDPDTLYTGGVAFVLWGVVAFSAQSVTQETACCTVVYTYTEVTVVALAMALLMFLGLLESVAIRLGVIEGSSPIQEGEI